jgi:enamine deaminase RidA (YjgF/YER057c/UK114 family)
MFEARLEALGVELPGPFPPHDPLDAVVVHRGTARTSGCLPRDVEGRFPVGLLGRDLTTGDGAAAAECCAWNAVSLLRAALGTLDGIERVLTVSVFIACVDGYAEQPQVADGASQALVRLFGAAGRHTRSAIGVAALPRKAPVEIEVTVALRRDG